MAQERAFENYILIGFLFLSWDLRMPVSCDFWVHDEGVDGFESYPKDYEIASSALYQRTKLLQEGFEPGTSCLGQDCFFVRPAEGRERARVVPRVHKDLLSLYPAERQERNTLVM